MIEHLDGIHETVTYKENSSLRLFVNTDCEGLSHSLAYSHGNHYASERDLYGFPRG